MSDVADDTTAVIAELQRSVRSVAAIAHAAVHCESELLEHVTTVAHDRLQSLIAYGEAENRETGPAGSLVMETQAVLAAMYASAVLARHGDADAGEFMAALDLLPDIMLDRLAAGITENGAGAPNVAAEAPEAGQKRGRQGRA